ncbi:hypothetical protein [Niabella hibiscisoli]|uniref:hypothetical protein n=1 Tax=Niabella hibiscisoli TaxID=1825928 RepID=UPI001F110F61|nr:hypothetical protein [Niabella hibiscisoli]MCH5714994.1 hypothetical protein [Niabella hibiscisoli]
MPVFAANRQYKIEDLQLLLDKCNNILLAVREQRVKPALDDKIILSWNALMNTAYSKAYAATGNTAYRLKAINNMKFLLSAFQTAEGRWQHVWKNDTAKYPAFLDDYAYLIQALLQLSRVTANTEYLVQAKELCEKVITDFSEPDGYFYYTPEQQTDIIVRKKEVYDGATPSGNSVMAQNLLELGLLFDQRDWLERSYQMTKGLGTVAVKYPTSFGVWLAGLYQQITGTKEVVLIGDFENSLSELLSQPLLHSIIMAAPKAIEAFPLLKDKNTDKPLALFLCENYACQQPVFSVNDLLKQLNKDGL